MKLHDSTIERLIHMFTTYGGHRSEMRLKRELKNVDFSVYEQQSGKQVIVESKALKDAKIRQRNK